MGWSEYPCGGPRGSEGGIIVIDEEHEGGARITLERDVSNGAAATITCGIYGWMMHTRFFSDLAAARKNYEEMKVALAEIVDRVPLKTDPDRTAKIAIVTQAISDFADKYP